MQLADLSHYLEEQRGQRCHGEEHLVSKRLMSLFFQEVVPLTLQLRTSKIKCVLASKSFSLPLH